MALLMFRLLSQPPGFFDLTLPTGWGEWLDLVVLWGGGGSAAYVWTRRLLRLLRRLPPGRERRRLFPLGIGGTLLGVGGFCIGLTWWFLWKLTIDDWNQVYHQAIRVPSSNLFDYTWSLWWLAFGMSAIGKFLYFQVRDLAQRRVNRLEEQGNILLR